MGKSAERPLSDLRVTSGSRTISDAAVFFFQSDQVGDLSVDKTDLVRSIGQTTLM